MKPPLLAFVSAAALAAGIASPAAAAAADAEPGPDIAMVAPRAFSPNDLLWLEVRAGGVLLTESMDAYASRAGVYLPLGQFARVLDLAVAVIPDQRRAEGWVMSRDNALVVDLASGKAEIGAASFALAPDQAMAFEDDIYVRLDLAERLLPVQLRADVSSQALAVTPLQPLPFQQRLERDARRQTLSQGGGADPRETILVTAPYALFSPPAFDVNLGGQTTRDGRDNSRRFDLRAAGDLAHAGFQGYVGSDDRGRVNDVRVLLERKDAEGHALADIGAFSAIGATRVGLGDVFSPASALGAASSGGRGVYYSSAPLETLDLSTPLDLRGELAVGEDVELYVNETLRGSQASPVGGRYEFLAVPLSVGLNTIRLVFYGSQGQKREETRRVNVGVGQVRPGQLAIQFAALQQGKTVFDPTDTPGDVSTGDPRLVVTADYGLGPALTVNGSLARFTPRHQAPRSTAAGGLRASLAGTAVQFDLGADDRGGSAAALALAGRPFGVAVVARRAEYSGGFIDEARQFLMSAGARLRSTTDLNATTNLAISQRVVLPLAIDLRHVERDGGSRRTTAETRTSAAVGRYYLSASLIQDVEHEGGWSRRQTGGRVDVASLATRDLQFRGGVSFSGGRGLEADTAYVSMDWRRRDGDTLHLGAVRTGGAQAGTSWQASYLIQARGIDLAANAAYETGSRAWRLGLQLGFAFAYDPTARAYRFTRPGASTTGAASIRAYVDSNRDGTRQEDEAPVAGVTFATPTGAVTTDAKGRAFAAGLADGGKVRVRVDAEVLDDPYLGHGLEELALAARGGRTLVVDYPMVRSSEVEVTVMLQRKDGAARSLSAVNLELTPVKGGRAYFARTDHAGVGFFENLPGGEYLLNLDAEQAEALGLRLADTVLISAPNEGGYVDGGEAKVSFRGVAP